MNNWKTIILGDHIDVLTDYHANGAYSKLKENIELKYEEDYAIMIRTLNLESKDFDNKLIYLNEREYNYLDKSKVYPYDIIMNKIANPGTVYLMPKLNKPVSLAMNLFLIRFKDTIDQVFVFHLMKMNEDYIKRFANGTTTKSITKDAVRALKFRVPNLSTQKQIAKVLSDLDAKIEVNNKINQELEAMAKTLYDYWFVQFEFPTSEAQAKQIGNLSLVGKPYKSSGSKMVFNTELKREIPEGWEDGTILDCADLLGGGTPKKEISKYWNGEIPFFTPTDTENNVFCLKTILYTNELGISKSSTKLFDKGTILITARGTVGKINIAGKPMAMNQSCYALKPKTDFSSEFIYFHTDQIVKYLKAKSSGSIFKAIVTNDFKFTPTVVPDTDIVKSYSKNTNSMFEMILNNKLQNQKLTELRDWLLPMLMNGQATVGSPVEKRDIGEVEQELGMVAEDSEKYGKV
ncbi:restriction endonuclease subunit S [Gelidibacter japonicus]|uniref:restriction endonuclease subunit S n=1 Tax=Gelidibacter japonicus TaxID=1962232 RepID=UPI002AFF4895|nr:restriction endonuclease subunit S [Gelidibacter japonicus]